MLLQEVRTGAKVQFIKIQRGKRVGLEDDIYTILDINFNDWGVCDILVESGGYEVYTTHEALELASDAAIKKWEDIQALQQIKEHIKYEQITIFEILEGA